MVGYHITNKKNLYSIVVSGLRPSIGFNSNKIGDRREQLFFTDKDHINYWNERLYNIPENERVILVIDVPEDKYYDNGEEFTTNLLFNSSNIKVLCDGSTISLDEYFKNNIKELEKLHRNKIIENLKYFLNKIAFSNLNNDDTVFFLKLLVDFSLLENKELYAEEISFISNNISSMIPEWSPNKSLFDNIFKRSFNEKISLSDISELTNRFLVSFTETFEKNNSIPSVNNFDTVSDNYSFKNKFR